MFSRVALFQRSLCNRSLTTSTFCWTTKRFCSQQNNNNNNNTEILSAIDQRLDLLEKIVSNLVADSQQQRQQQQNFVPQQVLPIDQQQQNQQISSNNNNNDNNSSSHVIAPSIMKSVVKVYSTVVAPNALLPWQRKNSISATGTAFVVDRKRRMLLTNAHVVAYASLIEVRRHGSAKRCVAECKFISGDCDLALLEVAEDSFWANDEEAPNFYCGSENVTVDENTNIKNKTTSLPPSLEEIAKISIFEGFPSLQSRVNVLGFPVGGDQISITSGVVSRIDQTPYSTSGLRLSGIQTDSNINPGNSGGPCIADSKVIGVAFQSLIQAEGIGYLIPNCVVAHFVRSYLALNNNNETTTTSTPTEVQRYHEGFPSVGLYYQELGNPTLRKHFGLPAEANGFLVEKVIRSSPNLDKLQAGDIIMRVDGKQIERDITIEWRPNERIQFTHLIHMRNPGEKMNFTVWRDKKETEVEVELRVPTPLVRPHLLHPTLAQKPPYCVFAGCVFTLLTVPYLEGWGAQWPNNGPRALVNNFLFGEISDSQTEIVVLAQILPHAINRGYSSDSFCHKAVSQVNGKNVKNFEEFEKLMKEAATNEEEEHVNITLRDSSFPLTMVLPRKEANEADELLTQQHGIPTSSLVFKKK